MYKGISLLWSFSLFVATNDMRSFCISPSWNLRDATPTTFLEVHFSRLGNQVEIGQNSISRFNLVPLYPRLDPIRTSFSRSNFPLQACSGRREFRLQRPSSTFICIYCIYQLKPPQLSYLGHDMLPRARLNFQILTRALSILLSFVCLRRFSVYLSVLRAITRVFSIHLGQFCISCGDGRFDIEPPKTRARYSKNFYVSRRASRCLSRISIIKLSDNPTGSLQTLFMLLGTKVNSMASRVKGLVVCQQHHELSVNSLTLVNAPLH